MRIDNQLFRTLLACPACKQPALLERDDCRCSDPRCGRVYPVKRGIPVLVNEDRSVFAIADYDDAPAAGVAPSPSLLGRLSERIVPVITHNWVGRRNYELLASRLRAEYEAAQVLVIGAGELGVGFDTLLDDPKISVAETDVYFAPRVAAIADCHDLPFADGAFDAVVVQAVLEHVADPLRCVDEIHRVLRPGGYVYAETPFLYPVHLGPYDFTRFTRGGHRRLFRHFEEVRHDMTSGPATALNLAIRSFFLGLSTSRWMTLFARNVLPFLIFWIKYADRWMLDNPQAADYATAFCFIGRKAAQPVSDRAIVDEHWSRAAR